MPEIYHKKCSHKSELKHMKYLIKLAKWLHNFKPTCDGVESFVRTLDHKCLILPEGHNNLHAATILSPCQLHTCLLVSPVCQAQSPSTYLVGCHFKFPPGIGGQPKQKPFPNPPSVVCITLDKSEASIIITSLSLTEDGEDIHITLYMTLYV